MATTEKVSVALGREELRQAKTAAEQDGISLSAFVTGAVRARIEERRRLAAARELVETFGPEELPSPQEQRDLLRLWAPARPRARRKSR